MNLFIALLAILCFAFVVIIRYVAGSMIKTRGYLSQEREDNVRLLNTISWLLILIGAATLIIGMI
jgi:hypothetical protein